MSYAAEFLLVASAHLLAVASPGPDFALVLRQSIRHGRATAIRTSLGIGSGILFHVMYSVLGLALLIRGSETVFTAVKYAGALYLIWIGLKALLARPYPEPSATGEGSNSPRRGAYVEGLLVNILNPKAMLFFIALFSVGVSPTTPLVVQVGYGLWMALATAAWFSLVSVFFTQPAVRARFQRAGHWFDRGMGLVFLALAVRLLVG